MKTKNLQRGFAPLLIVAILAILALGGGSYVVVKNNQAKKVQPVDNPDTQANANADKNANENANLGINAKAKNSLRSLLALGQNTKCTFASTKDNVSSSGTVYLGANGDMRGEFENKTGTQATVTSNMIVKGGISYVWSGTQGAKMDVPDVNMKKDGVEKQANKEFEQFDAEMDYNCSPWTLDDSKFTIPTGVNFMDLNALLKGGIKIPDGEN